MGKRDNAHDEARANMVEEVIRHVHDARDVLNALGQALVHDNEKGIAGRIFVLAEQLRAGALDLRIDFTGGTPGDGLTLAPKEEKPKRVRGPRKRKESADARTLPLATRDTDRPPPMGPNGAVS